MYIITFHYIPYHHIGVSHWLTMFLFICLSLLLYCSVMWAERTGWGSMCDQRQLVVSRDDNILQSNTQCVQHHTFERTVCVFYIGYCVWRSPTVVAIWTIASSSHREQSNQSEEQMIFTSGYSEICGNLTSGYSQTVAFSVWIRMSTNVVCYDHKYN